MKKIVALLMVMVLCVSLCGCGKKAETVSPEDAIAPEVERYVKLECHLKERLYGEIYRSMTISDIVNREGTGIYDVKGVYTTIDEDGVDRYYAFTLNATYYSDGNVIIDENSYADIDAKWLAAAN